MSLSRPKDSSSMGEERGIVPELHPEILMHPNIPKPLHEVNPRNIMGREKWDILRKQVYASTDYHCIACGVHQYEALCHQWLEAHEFYDIDYKLGRVTIKKIIPLCHYCHNFIHSGRLQMVMGEEKTEDEVRGILEHGFKVLSDSKLNCFYATLHLAHVVGAKTFGVQQAPVPAESGVSWEDWRLVWDGIEYPPKYKTYEKYDFNFRAYSGFGNANCTYGSIESG